MGLDIIIYKNLKKVDNVDRNVDRDVDRYWTPGPAMDWSEKHFPGRGEGVDSNSYYNYDDYDSFRAGSYSGYGWWRAKLELLSKIIKSAQIVKSKDVKESTKHIMGKDDPFIELTNFADNQGVIGPVISKKLYNDFCIYEKEAIEFSKTFEDGDYWLEKYTEWKNAFRMASENGAVEFC